MSTPDQPADPDQPQQPTQPEQAQPTQAPSQSQAPEQPQASDQPQPPQYQQYAPPQPPQAPQQPQYAPPQPPQQPQYAAPQQPLYSAPQQPQHGAPHYAQYAAPQQPQYAAAILPPPGPGEPFDGTTNVEDLSRPFYGISFGDAVKRFFKNYANFTGRASRSEYWWAQLFIALLMVIPGILYFSGFLALAATSSSNSYSGIDGYNTMSSAPSGIGIAMLLIGGILLFAVSLGVLVPSIAISWRRLHDANFAGPLYFLSFIPYVGSFVLIVLTVLPSKPEGRRFLSSK